MRYRTSDLPCDRSRMGVLRQREGHDLVHLARLHGRVSAVRVDTFTNFIVLAMGRSY
jgi:hypothetical protein